MPPPPPCRLSAWPRQARAWALPLAVLLSAAGAAWAAPPPRSACDGDFQAVLQAAPEASALPAQALWLNARLLRWPALPPAADGARYRLYHAARGQIVATPGEPVRGADGAWLLTPHATPLPAKVAARFP